MKKIEKELAKTFLKIRKDKYLFNNDSETVT